MTAEQKRFVLERIGRMPQSEIARLAKISEASVSRIKMQAARAAEHAALVARRKGRTC